MATGLSGNLQTISDIGQTTIIPKTAAAKDQHCKGMNFLQRVRLHFLLQNDTEMLMYGDIFVVNTILLININLVWDKVHDFFPFI